MHPLLKTDIKSTFAILQFYSVRTHSKYGENIPLKVLAFLRNPAENPFLQKL